jgi:polar amino acid transport system ATP-binding protein
MNAEIEAFCEKQILPKKTRYNLLLLVEELLTLFRPRLGSTVLDLTIAYSEKTERLEVVVEATGNGDNPLAQETSSEGLGLMIIRNLAESIEFRAEAGRDILEVKMKQPVGA